MAAAAAAASPSSSSGCDVEPAEEWLVALPSTGTVAVVAVVVVFVVAAVAAAEASESLPRDWAMARAPCCPPLEGPAGTMRPCRQLLNGRGEGRADVMLHALRRVPATGQQGGI